jgi:eukaryotic-like serine/threonine-protein kinase
MIWQSGTLIRDKYTIERELGRGGFGITYLARDRQQRPFVIKTLWEENISANLWEYFRDDFYNEAVRLARVSDHPRIVSVIETLHHQGYPCIIMEYIEGKNLEDWIQEERCSESEILDYVRQVGEALEYVHERKFLHRDIKPQNIIIRKNGQEAILIDFGIARSFDSDRTTSVTTVQFLSAGYTPPEQISPTFGKPQPYTDVYSLAATLYSCLTGILPPKAEERVSQWASDRTDPLIEPRQRNSWIGAHLNWAILQGLAIRPLDRPATVREWLDLWEEDSIPTVSSTDFPDLPTLPPSSPASMPTVSASPVTPRRNLDRFKPWIKMAAIAVVGLLSLWLGRALVLSRLSSESASYSNEGLSVNYPSDWQLTSFEAIPFDPTIARFTPRSKDENNAPVVTIAIQELPNPMTLREASEQKAKEIAENLSNATQQSQREFQLNHHDAYELVYQGRDGDREIQKQQVGILQNQKLYTITYQADVREYSQYAQEARGLIDSATLTP